MKKIFLLFGATGNLGSDSIKYFLNERYDKYYLIARSDFEVKSKKNISKIIVDDLKKETNVKNAFESFTVEKDAAYFLFCTIGGYSAGQYIKDTQYKNWLSQLDINLNIPFLISKYFSRLVSKTKGGSICFISSTASFKPEKKKVPYSVSKNSLNFFVRNLALEGKDYNLSANALAVYAIDSEENRKWVADKSLLISTDKICMNVQKLFKNWNEHSGKIIKVANK